MRKFWSRETFPRGAHTVYVIDRNQIPSDIWNPSQLQNETIMLNGSIRKVVAVEAFAIMCSPDHPYRHSFGLLVEEPA